MADVEQKWLIARDAVALLRPYFATDALIHKRLVEWSRDDMIGSRCERRANEQEGVGKVYYDDEPIPSEFWTDFDDDQKRSSNDWVAGAFSVFLYDPFGSTTVRVQGVEFCEDDIRARMKTLPAAGAGASATHEPGAESLGRGAPKKDYWEDIWAEVAAQIAVGELSAFKAADVERVMLGWAEENGKPLSESTARLRAQKLMGLIKKKADKSKP